MPATKPQTFPWSKLEPGQGFFVPGLDVARVRELGLRAAMHHPGLKAKATPGIRRGLLGVWFTRLQ